MQVGGPLYIVTEFLVSDIIVTEFLFSGIGFVEIIYGRHPFTCISAFQL